MSEKKKSKLKVIIVIIFTMIVAMGLYMSYRSNYLQTLEIGENYLSVFQTNCKYYYQALGFHFVLFFILIVLQTVGIKKGLKPFFLDEKKEIPKLPNKSIAYIIAVILSLIVNHFVVEKYMVFANSIWTGTTDPIFHLDISFFLFQKPFIELLLLYGIGILVFSTIYMSIYYIAVFNIYLSGVDKELLKKSSFTKQLRINAFLIIVLVASMLFLNTYNIEFGQFLTLKDGLSTKLIGAGLSDVTIKLWGYRILSIVVIISGVLIIKTIGKENLKKVLCSILIVPAYLVGMFVIVLGFNLLFVNNNRLDKEMEYIGYNLEYTKSGYGLTIAEEELESAESITKKDLKENAEILQNITLVDNKTTLDTLESLQTNYGYYTYRNTKLQKYMVNGEETAVYVSPREIAASSGLTTYNNKTYEYTHGYGTIISYASKVDSNGNVKYVQKSLDDTDKQILVSEPRIYFGTENNGAVIINRSGKTEFDYPINSTKSKEYTYTGSAGIHLNFIDRVILSVMNRDINIAFSNSLNAQSKVIMNRNVVERAKTIMPYLMYDKKPYLVISDEGKQVWVLDAYTVSNEYPYSQKSLLEQNGSLKKEINYIRNSVKVLIDAYDGTTTFYIMDETDPIIMLYQKIYPELFKQKNEIPKDIIQHFTYPEYLYHVQSDILKYYHNVTEDVLYRGNDVWEYTTFTNNKTVGLDTKMKPYYTMVKSKDSKNKIGLVIPYTGYGKQNIVAYLVGTIDDNGALELSLYKYAQGSNVLGPKQLEKVIEQDETISNTIESVNVTGTKILKNLTIVPVNQSLVYVETIYQQQLNEKEALPLLKKVIVASGNKVTIGNTLEEALEKLVSQSATNIEVENTDTMNDLINTIIDANKNLKESTKSSDYEMIGKDITKLQSLIDDLQVMQEQNEKKQEKEATKKVNNNQISEENTVTK